MPRAKYDPNNPYNTSFIGIGFFKVNYGDILYDLRYIYQDILDFFGDDLGEYTPSIKQKLHTVQNAKVEPTLNNRMYLITNIDSIAFVAVNLDDAVFDHLVDSHLPLENLLHGKIPEAVNMSYISKMYLFKEDKLCCADFISPWQLARFMAVFHKENVVDFQGARDFWYASPRREAKRNKKD